ncbi:uncharacterized protein LOC122523761 [Polistes fuscatus]|uniref:uncharacterized protein LOC122523761 n=1 Tax=Polistes fuscatus TaxID=30207 RepID=UPI001CA9823D|nr:uncharacterized protein LOC122523761 [Polistes fuscatus]
MTQSEDSWSAQPDEAPDDMCSGNSSKCCTSHKQSRDSHRGLTQLQQLSSHLPIWKTRDSFGSRQLRQHTSRMNSLCSEHNLTWQALTHSANSPPHHNEGVLSVGGRLRRSELSYDTKHPAIIPRTSRFSELIIAHSHKQTMHRGTQSTLAFIRQLYWIVGGRALVKSHILRCVMCARHKGICAQQLMKQLPLARVIPSRPFSHTGIDYAGPLTLKTWRGRGAKTYKGWICVFVCSQHRLLTLKGSPTTPLKGSSQHVQLKRCFAASSPEHLKFSVLLAQDNTQWHINPPAAPHMGGKWEAAVKSLKFHVERMVGDTLLTYEEASTLLTQIEAILNSRPLEPLSDDPEDTTVLTPGHFLIGTALNALPEHSLLDVSGNRLSRWQFIQQQMQQFWRLWSTQYLQRLQAISKLRHNNIQVGSLVLLTNERLPPGKWPMTRVLKLLPGKNGLTRVVSLKTATTTLTRPIAKLAVLPVTQQEDA